MFSEIRGTEIDGSVSIDTGRFHPVSRWTEKAILVFNVLDQFQTVRGERSQLFQNLLDNGEVNLESLEGTLGGETLEMFNIDLGQ